MPDLSYEAFLRSQRAVNDAAVKAGVTPRSDNPIFGGPSPTPEQVLGTDDQSRIARILAGDAPDTLPPEEIKASTGLRSALDNLDAGTGPLAPLGRLGIGAAKGVEGLAQDMALEPLHKLFVGARIAPPRPVVDWNKGGTPILGLDGKPMTEAIPSGAETAIAGAQTAANLAFPGAIGFAEKALAEQVPRWAAGKILPELIPKIAAEAAGASGVMGAQGAITGGVQPADNWSERFGNAATGAASGAEAGAAMGAGFGLAGAAIGRGAGLIAEPTLRAAAAIGPATLELATQTVEKTRGLLQDFSLDPAKFADNRDIRSIMQGAEGDINRPRPASASDRRVLAAQQPPAVDPSVSPVAPPSQGAIGYTVPEPTSPAPAPVPAETPRQITPAMPKFDFVTSDRVYSPGNMARFARVGHVPGTPLLEGDPVLRDRIRNGEDLTDAEVHQAEPNHLTPFDIAKVEHPLKPGTTIGADLKRDRIRGLVEHGALRTPSEQLDRVDTINQLRTMQGAVGGNEFGDLEGLIQKIKNDPEPLTVGRLRAHQIDDVTEHFQNLARSEGVDLNRGRKATILIGPPGSGKSAVASALGKATGAYQIDADAFKTRDPRYPKIGASGTHPESDLLATRARQIAVRRGDSIILPMIGKNTGKISDLVKELTKQGYEVNLGLTDLSPNESAVRAYNRGLEQNRIVHPDYVIHGVGVTPQTTFDKLKGMDEIGGRYVKINSDTPRGTPLHAKISELGLGLDRSIFGGAAEGDPVAHGYGRPGGEGVPAAEGRAPEGVPGADHAGSGEPTAAAPSAAEDLFGNVPEKRNQAPAEEPALTEPGRVTTDPYKVATSSLRVDPQRFQFKQDVEKTTGASTSLHGARRFNADYAGILDVWKDPENGQTYVVNGHHRFNLAKRDGVKSLQVRNIVASNAVEARVFGALTNIAEGKGTALDVAKFIKDSGLGVEGLIERDINIRKGLARDGTALANLSNDLIARVTQDPELTRKAVIVGEHLEAPEQQRAAFRSMGKMTERELVEFTHQLKTAGSESATQENLFGTESIAKSLFVEKAKVASAIRDRLLGDKRLFGYVANEGRAAELERGGNKISVEQSRAIADQSAQLEEVFSRLYSKTGELGQLMDQAGKRVARGEKPAKVAQDIYERVQAAVQREIPASPLRRAGRIGSHTSDVEGARHSGRTLGGVAGSGLGAAAGGIIGGHIGSTPEERKRNAELGAGLGLGVGAAGGAEAADRGFDAARPEVRPRESDARVFDVQPTGKRIEIKIQGRPSTLQLNDLVTQLRENPGKHLRYSIRDTGGRSIGTGSSVPELFSAIRRAGGRIGAAGDQPDMFGHVAPTPDQGGLFGEDVGTAAAQAKSGKPFEQVKEEARANAIFLRKQYDQMIKSSDRKWIGKGGAIAQQIADLERIANFDEKIQPAELALRNRTGAIGAQPESPYREPADRGSYAGESDLLNIGKIVDGSTAQERVANQVEQYRTQHDANKQTWAEADKLKSKVVQELLAGDRKAARPHIARKLTGVQLLARRDVVRQNDGMIEDLSKQLASGKLTLEEHQTASELLSKAVAHNDALLSDLVTGASQKGRDLNLLKRMANTSLDHDVWQIQAKRMLGARPLDDATAAELRRLVNVAREACAPGLEATGGGGRCLFAKSKLAQFTSGLRDSPIAEKAGTLIKVGYLSSPKTNVRKLASDITFGGVEYLATRPLAVATDYLQAVARSAATFGKIKPTEFRQLANTLNWPAFLQGIKGFRDGAVKGVQLMKTGVDPEKGGPAGQGNLFDLQQTTYKNKTLERVTHATFDRLEAQTKPFYGFAYNTSLFGRARLMGIREGLSGSGLTERVNELLANPTEQMVLGSHADAQYAVFKNETTLSKFAGGMRSSVRRKLSTAKPGDRAGLSVLNLALDITIPFTKLPSAILMAGVDYSPAGFIKALVHAADPDPLIQGQLQKQLARATIGTGLTMVGYALEGAGNMTGSSPTDPGQRRIWDAENKQANSIKLNGRWRGITSLGPLALPLLLGANLRRYSDTGPEKSGSDLAIAGATSMAKTITEESYLQGVSNLIGALADPGARGATAAAGMVPIPAIVGQAATAIDPAARETHGIGQKLEAKIPFLSKRLPARLDPFGQEIQKNTGGIRGAAESFLDPTSPKTDASTALTKELERLQVGIAKPGSTYSVKGVKQQRSPERIRDLTKEIGPEYRAKLEDLIVNPRYTRASDDEKERLIRKEMASVRKPVYRKERQADLSYDAFQSFKRAQLEGSQQ